MQVKFILKNLTEQFYNGFGDSMPGFNTLPPYEKYKKLMALKVDLPRCIQMQDMQFNRVVDLNALIKTERFTCAHESSPRRGYQVHTFTFSKGE